MYKSFILFVIVVLSGIAIYFGFTTRNDCQLPTPDIQGIEFKSVNELFLKRGMTIVVMDTIHRSDLPVGVIASQYPEPGVKNCDTVFVSVNQ